jgi:hypothetical protein
MFSTDDQMRQHHIILPLRHFSIKGDRTNSPAYGMRRKPSPQTAPQTAFQRWQMKRLVQYLFLSLICVSTNGGRPANPDHPHHRLDIFRRQSLDFVCFILNCARRALFVRVPVAQLFDNISS